MSLNDADHRVLLELASASIQHGLLTRKPLPINLADYAPALQENRATFVTLKINNQLRGCIGTLEARRPLVQDIVHNAYAAAFADSRFVPVSRAEFDQIKIHLSLLTPAEEMTFASERDLLAQLQPTVDGLILQEGGRRGTFLPSVWESLTQPEQFLRHLKQKAGLPVAYWSDSIRCFRYRAESIT